MKFSKKCHKRKIEIVKSLHELNNRCKCPENAFGKIPESSELTGIENGTNDFGIINY